MKANLFGEGPPSAVLPAKASCSRRQQSRSGGEAGGFAGEHRHLGLELRGGLLVRDETSGVVFDNFRGTNFPGFVRQIYFC